MPQITPLKSPPPPQGLKNCPFPQRLCFFQFELQLMKANRDLAAAHCVYAGEQSSCFCFAICAGEQALHEPAVFESIRQDGCNYWIIVCMACQPERIHTLGTRTAICLVRDSLAAEQEIQKNKRKTIFI